MEIVERLMAFTYANVFRTYHLQISAKEPSLMQYGLTNGSQDLLHRALTGRLSPPISFDDLYLPLPLDDLELEPRHAILDEKGKRIPVPISVFERNALRTSFRSECQCGPKIPFFCHRDGFAAKLPAT